MTNPGGNGTRGSALLSRLAHEAAKVRADLPLALLDVVLIATAYAAALLFRFDGAVPERFWLGFLAFLPIALGVHLLANAVAGLYGKVWLHAGVHEARRVLWAGGGAGAVLVPLLLVGERRIPLSVLLVGLALSPLLVGFLRFYSRLFAFRRVTSELGAQRVLVVGGGEAGAAVIRDMLRRPDEGYAPIAVLDDDPRKQRRDVATVPIVGTVDEIAEAVARLDPDEILLAIPSADRALVQRVVAVAEEHAVAVSILPRVSEVVGGTIGLKDVRELEIADLLGRDQVVTDLDSVHALLAGRRVLVTGAGGSIGAEIARQVAAAGPAELLLVDNDETHLHDTQATIDHAGTEALLDIRDRRRVRELFEAHRPHVVFHAAALKHVPVLETHPGEAVRTNVAGTVHVAEAAAAVGTAHFVYISTDKAVRPCSVMGATKRVGEYVVEATAPAGSAWCAVRFGNVLGSRGSVIPTFVRQIRNGGPVRVTDPGVARYFMSNEEAVQLVLQAAVLSDGQDTFMLEMGEPVRIVDLAERMIRLSGRRVGHDVAIEFTGLRPGEKLSEELRHPWERPQPTPHPSIMRLQADTLNLRAVEEIPALIARAEASDDEGARGLLFELADAESLIDLASDSGASTVDVPGT